MDAPPTRTTRAARRAAPRAARAPRSARAAAGARIRRVRLTGMRRAVEYYLATLRDGAGADLLEVFALEQAPRVPRTTIDTLRRRGDHTLQFVLLLAVDRLSERIPASY